MSFSPEYNYDLFAAPVQEQPDNVSNPFQIDWAWVGHKLKLDGNGTAGNWQTENDYKLSLAGVYRKFCQERVWYLPEWQREYVWNRKDRRGWYDTIVATAKNYEQYGGLIPGTIILGRIKDDPARGLFINDGHQRLHSTVKFVNDLIEDDPSRLPMVMAMLERANIKIEHIVYETQMDACLHFYSINRGTLCTGWEQGQSVYAALLPNFHGQWKQVFRDIDKAVFDGMLRLGMRSMDAVSRETRDKNKRDNAGLFLRFLIKDKARNSYRTSCKQIAPQDYYSERLLERRLIKEFLAKGIGQIRKQVANFTRFIDQHIALYKKFWQESESNFEDGTTPGLTHIKFFLLTSIYRRNCKISGQIFHRFVKVLIHKTAGLGSTRINGRKVGGESMSLGDLGKLDTLCKAWDQMEMIHYPKRGSLNYEQVTPGYEYSHEKSFAHTGHDGKKRLEPAPINRSRGTRDMEIDEKA